MTLKTRLILIKVIGMCVGIPFVFSLLFYLGIIIPEYCACDSSMYEGATGTTIWGDLVDCGGDSMDFSESFFQLFTIINLAFTIVLMGLFFYYKNVRSKQRMENSPKPK